MLRKDIQVIEQKTHLPLYDLREMKSVGFVRKHGHPFAGAHVF